MEREGDKEGDGERGDITRVCEQEVDVDVVFACVQTE